MVATFKLHQKSFKLWILKWALYKCFQIMDVLCHFEYKHSWFQHSLGLKVALAESGLCKDAQTPSSPGDSYGTWTFLYTCFSAWYLFSSYPLRFLFQKLCKMPNYCFGVWRVTSVKVGCFCPFIPSNKYKGTLKSPAVVGGCGLCRDTTYIPLYGMYLV